MNFLFALLVLVALVVCTFAQYPYYSGYYNTHHSGYPYAYNYGAYNYGAYNPALSYVWK